MVRAAQSECVSRVGAMAHENIVHECGVFVGLVVHQLPGVEEQVTAHYGVAEVKKLQRIAVGGHTEQEKDHCDEVIANDVYRSYPSIAASSHCL